MRHTDAIARATGATAAVTPPALPGTDPVLRREVEAIFRETDAGLRGTQLMALAGRLEQSGRAESAAELYASLAALSGQEPSMGARAARRLAALLGRGAFGGRFEVLSRQFSRQALDPRLIAPMLLGSVAFGVARNFSLARLLTSAEAGFFTRGWGARGLAGLAGFGVEVPVFVAAARGLGGAQGPLDKDLLGATLSLGALKLFGLAGREAAAFVAPRSQYAAWSRALPEASGFFGLLAAHRLEQAAGLRPRLDGATTLTDTFAAWFSLGIGSRLGTRLLGPRFAAFQAELQARSEAAAPAPRPPLPDRVPIIMTENGAAALPEPGMRPLWMASTPLDRLFAWLGERIRPAAQPSPEFRPEEVPQERMQETLKVVLRRFPKLKRALSQTDWTLEQKWELLKAVTAGNNPEPWEVFKVLPKALSAFQESGWSYEQQLNLLRLLSRLGPFPVPVHRYLPQVLAAVRGLPLRSVAPTHNRPTNQQMEYDLLYTMTERAAGNADRLYSNLPSALKSMKEGHWDFEQQAEFLQLLCRYADHRIGGVLSHLPTALHYLAEHGWKYSQQVRLMVLIAWHAQDDLHTSWMMEDHLPAALGMMADFEWNPAMQGRLLVRMLERAEGQSARALEYFPGMLHTMRSVGWHSEDIYNASLGYFERAGKETGNFIEIAPAMLQAMRVKGWSLTTQRETLEALAAHAAGLPKFAFANFALEMLKIRLDRKPN